MHSKCYFVSVAYNIIIVVVIKSFEAGIIAIADVFCAPVVFEAPNKDIFTASHLVVRTILLLFTLFRRGNQNAWSSPCIILRT